MIEQSLFDGLSTQLECDIVCLTQGGFWDPTDDCCEDRCTEKHPCPGEYLMQLSRVVIIMFRWFGSLQG